MGSESEKGATASSNLKNDEISLDMSSKVLKKKQSSSLEIGLFKGKETLNPDGPGLLKSQKFVQILIHLETLLKVLLMNLESLQKDVSQLCFPAQMLFQIENNPKFERMREMLRFEPSVKEPSGSLEKSPDLSVSSQYFSLWRQLSNEMKIDGAYHIISYR